MARRFDKTQLSELFQFLGPQVLKLIFVSLLTGVGLFAAESAFAVSMQLFLKALGVTQQGVSSGPQFLREASLTTALALVVLFVVGRSLLNWAQNYVQYAACYTFIHKIRSRILNWIFKTDYVQTSEVMHNYGDRAYASGVAILFLQMTTSFAAVAVLLFATLLYLLPLPTLVGTAFLGIVYLPLKKIMKATEGSGEDINALSNLELRHMLLSLQNLLFLKIYSIEEREKQKQSAALDEIKTKYLHYHKISGLAATLPNVVGILVICAIVLTLHGSPYQNSSFLIAYFYLFFRFLQAAASVAQNYTNFVFHLPSLIHLGKWWIQHSEDSPRRKLLEKPKVQQIPMPAVLPLGWRLNGITFAYPGKDQAIFHDFNLTIAPGESFAIIGPSGSGKSTLIGLLLDQLSPQEGHIEVLDKKGQSFPLEPVRKSLLSKVGYVGPEPFLFNGTIRENLTYGLETNPTEAELARAIQLAECQFVHDLNKKFDHRLTDQGQGLSAGQKQRLALARALLRNSAILVLDEATANLDYGTERSLIKTLQTLKETMTLIIVTHRESLLVLADRTLELPSQKLSTRTSDRSDREDTL